MSWYKALTHHEPAAWKHYWNKSDWNNSIGHVLRTPHEDKTRFVIKWTPEGTENQRMPQNNLAKNSWSWDERSGNQLECYWTDSTKQR